MSKPFYGGQAIIEGVMMRGQRTIGVAVRHPAGHIVTYGEPLRGLIYDSRWVKMPLVRGLLMLWEMLVIGTRMLMYSAEVAMSEEENKGNAEMPKGVLWGTVVLALAGAVVIFFVLPVVITSLLDRWVSSAFLSNLVEKLVRLTLLVGYIALVGRLPDIRRVFAYHGAEHKTINAYEDGAPLDVEHVRKYSTAHPRCGTSFLLVVVVVSFFVYLLLGKPPMMERIASRVLLIPVIAGIAYELIRLGANHSQRSFVKALLAPGLALQRLTTREPDDQQIETAIAALKQVFSAECVPYASNVPEVSASEHIGNEIAGRLPAMDHLRLE